MLNVKQFMRVYMIDNAYISIFEESRTPRSRAFNG